jgi:chromosome segregation ATPase
MQKASPEIAHIADRLEQLSNRIDELTAKPDADGMREFVQHRRDIAGLFLELSRIVEARITDLPESEKLPASAALRKTLTEFRRGLANLQADWPLPEITADVSGYRKAKAAFNPIQSRFLEEIRNHLAAQ